ncbi:MAG: AIR synthase-related protein [Thermomicrobiales bacterium]
MATPTKNDVLSMGKLPGELLAVLLSGLGSGDDSIIVGPGIGRDAAAVRLGDSILVLKTDPITFASSGAGRFLINVNANDLACLGATPKWMLVTAMFPVGTTQEAIAESFEDIKIASAERGIALVGGHTEITSSVIRPVLVGMLAGIAEESRFLRPGGAREGDLLLLSRPIAIEGSALLASEQPRLLSGLIGPEFVERATNLLDSPGISVGRHADVALSTGPVHAMHDPTEGGIAMGAREIAEASGLAIELDRDAIPVLPETVEIAGALNLDPLGMLASGSLLVASAPEDADRLIAAWRESGSEAAIVGSFVAADRGHALIVDGERQELPVFHLDEVSRVLQELSS